MLHYNKSFAGSVCLSAVLFASCTVPKTAVRDNKPEVPKHFSATGDTTASIATISREAFFKDQKLQAVIKDVLAGNPDRLIALERIKIAGAWLRISRSALLPSLSANANAGATKFGKYTMEGVGNFDTNLSPNIDDAQRVGTNPTQEYWLGLSSTWELDIWGRLRNMKKAAQQRYLASAEGARWLNSVLTAQSAALYYELVALDNEARIINENISLQERALQIVEAQKEGGRASELAVQQFRAQLLNTQGSAYAVRQRIAEAEATLNALAGKYNAPLERSANLKFAEHFDSSISAGVPTAMLEHRADIREAQAELEATKADLAAARAAFFPTVNISAYTAFSAFSGSLLFSGSSLGYQLLGGLVQPIFHKHQIRSQFRIATANQEQAFYNLQKAALNAYREVTTQLSAIANFRQAVRLKRDEVSALQQAVEASNDLYVAGYASYLEIVAAQRSKLESELQLVHLQRSEVQAMVELYKALGAG